MKPEGDSGGWVRLYRSLFCHEFADEPWDRITAWMYLVSIAAYKPYDAVYRRHVYHLERGQAAIVMSDFGAKAGWSKWRVKRFLDLLVTKQMIQVSSDSICCILTVCNYEKYQVGTLLESAVAAATPSATPSATATATANDSPILTVEGIPATATATASATAAATQNKNVLRKVQETKNPPTPRKARVAFDKQTGQFIGLSEELQSKLRSTYPGVDLPQVIREAQLWAADNRRTDYWGSLKAFCEHSIPVKEKYNPNKSATDVHMWDNIKGW